MSSVEPSDAADQEDLQFENAEYAEPGAGVACVACKQDVTGTYYEVNGQVLCDRCRAAVEAHRGGGSGVARFARALVFGGVAAVAGFLIYFGVMKIADMEIGLISILVGFMVGAAVRNGSRHRGGWLYQLLAVFLTYSAIAASYSAAVLPMLFANAQKEHAAAPGVVKGPGALPGPRKPGPAAGPQPAPAARAAPADRGTITVVGFVVALAAVFGLCYALPVIVGFQQPIGLLIVAFALWEAWKLNKRVPFVMNGPFEVGTAADPHGFPPEGIPGHA